MALADLPLPPFNADEVIVEHGQSLYSTEAPDPEAFSLWQTGEFLGELALDAAQCAGHVATEQGKLVLGATLGLFLIYPKWLQ